MSEVLMNVVTAAMFAALAFGLLRRPLARWKTRLERAQSPERSADREPVPNVPLWVAIAAGMLILGLGVLLAQACLGSAG
jgi:hypothetical protein